MPPVCSRCVIVDSAVPEVIMDVGGLCVTGVTAGSLQPDKTRQAIPPLSVPS